MHSQVKQTINPYFPLDDIFYNWNEISKELAENPRKRGLQAMKYEGVN